jgi:16S rRNA (adenine1518-N6/adenine1519-N6)-dimethyltransferase
VDSAVAVFRPLSPEARFDDVDAIEKVATAAFGQRRKMLRAALKPLAKTVGLDSVVWLEESEIDPTSRAETLTQTQFRALASTYRTAHQCS